PFFVVFATPFLSRRVHTWAPPELTPLRFLLRYRQHYLLHYPLGPIVLSGADAPAGPRVLPRPALSASIPPATASNAHRKVLAIG
ncbi:hypothetical protein R0K18_32610, partial [Pantoea sp. SIMBA_133]